MEFVERSDCLRCLQPHCRQIASSTPLPTSGPSITNIPHRSFAVRVARFNARPDVPCTVRKAKKRKEKESNTEECVFRHHKPPVRHAPPRSSQKPSLFSRHEEKEEENPGNRGEGRDNEREIEEQTDIGGESKVE